MPHDVHSPREAIHNIIECKSLLELTDRHSAASNNRQTDRQTERLARSRSANQPIFAAATEVDDIMIHD